MAASARQERTYAEQIQGVWELYERGLSSTEIGQLFEVSADTVLRSAEDGDTDSSALRAFQSALSLRRETNECVTGKGWVGGTGWDRSVSREPE